MSELLSAAGRAAPLPESLDDDPDGFAALLEKVERERLFQCRNYKERCLRRRIAVRMRAASVHTYPDYARVLDHDASEYDRLLDALTINVTKLFRNSDAWQTLGDVAMRPRVADPRRPVRVWSAGTSSGEEAYTAAALVHAQLVAEGRGTSGDLEVLGTDVDRASLAAATEGVYAASAFVEVPLAFRDRYFTPGYPARVRSELRAVTSFMRHDLLRDAAPAGPWDLIICRNVVIYFDRDSQEALFERFHGVLAPGGLLFLGKVETLLGRVRGMYVPVDHRQRIFRRV
ncbi:MAG TPA: protein-glutamate O-methyltransferase CheR [Gemmatirosa sp.]